MASITIYSVAERIPPIDEPLLLWDIADNGYVIEVREVEALIAIPEDAEEYTLIPKHVYPEMVWGDYMQNGHSDMLRDDKWSFAKIERGI